ncbi:response regulator [Halobacteriovorax sp. HLS]|uniref:response regulator n=1 Tax=Halobacteriovorax sp. HLS TaxID=2234000 RepID=UPI000FDA930B|nr:response regulator [Halobacteriovorax sp. HLS]
MNLPIMDDDFKNLQHEYALELPDLIDTVESNLMSIETQSNIEKSIKDLKRVVHSIKGTAGSYELKWVSSLCHQFEDQLDDTQDALIMDPKKNIEQFFKYVDLFRSYVASFLDGAVSQEEFDIALRKLRQDPLLEVDGESIEKRKVLIVESASTLLKAYKLLISSLDMNYSTAMSGREGFERLLIEKYDYLITGHATGIVDGPSLIAITKVFNGASRGVKTILTTSIDQLDLEPEQMPDILIEKKLGMMEKIKEVFSEESAKEVLDETTLPFKKVLCIDDDNAVLKLLKLAFSKQEDVEFFFSNHFNKSEIQVNQPELILLDYFIDDRTGVDILKELRDECGYEGEVVFLTGTTSQDDLQEMYDSSASGIIEKPFNPKSLYQLLADIFKKAA